MQGELDNIETKLALSSLLTLGRFLILGKRFFATTMSSHSILFVDRKYCHNPFHLLLDAVIFMSPMLSIVEDSLLFSCAVWNIVQELFHALVGLMIASDGFVSLLNPNSYVNTVGRLSRYTGFERVGIIITRLDTCFLSSIFSLSAALVAVGWEALLLYDLLLFGMTLAKAYQARYQLGPRHIRGMSLISVIIRDGTIYFAIMSLVNFVNVFTFYINHPLGDWELFTQSGLLPNHELPVRHDNVQTDVTPSQNWDSRNLRRPREDDWTD
ncbi:hypothetical protein F5877DRAFT_66929 [Lentinula edodes]|nr:hypothetical protein F5877DRAFT_66929 [Lentinula edodes]